MKTRIELGVFTHPYHAHDEWIYQDIVAYPNVDIVCDAKSLPMIETGSMDEVYASHIVEHFYFEEVVYVLREWVRLLKKGGVLTIVLPDFMKVWEMIIAKEKPKFMEEYKDTVEDWGMKIMANSPDRPDSHRNHYPHYWYKKRLEELNCTVEVGRIYKWVVPEVVIRAIKQ